MGFIQIVGYPVCGGIMGVYILRGMGQIVGVPILWEYPDCGGYRLSCGGIRIRGMERLWIGPDCRASMLLTASRSGR